MKEGLRTSVCIQNPLEGQRESTRIERVFKDWREKKGKKKTNKNKRSLSYLQLRLLLSVIETYIHIHTQQSTSRRWRMPFFLAAFDRHFRCSWTWSSICSSSSSSSLSICPHHERGNGGIFRICSSHNTTHVEVVQVPHAVVKPLLCLIQTTLLKWAIPHSWVMTKTHEYHHIVKMLLGPLLLLLMFCCCCGCSASPLSAINKLLLSITAGS
jgi:hypothetical protein